MPTSAPIIVLFGADLRLEDQPALHAVAAEGAPVLPLYILDDSISWAPGAASRWWLHHSLQALAENLETLGAPLILRRGPTVEVLQDLLAETAAEAVFVCDSAEPGLSAHLLSDTGLPLRVFPGNWLHQPGEVLTGGGAPFKVFTPFYKACLNRRVTAPLPVPRTLVHMENPPDSDQLDSWGLLPSPVDWAGGLRETWQPGERGALEQLDRFIDDAIANYKEGRDIPGKPGTSRLSAHLHFGEISARTVWHRISRHAEADSAGAASFLRELVWREFSLHLLHHFPSMPDAPLRSEFASFPWQDDTEGFEAWSRGLTGYPIVDAGMRELWHTGWMHNRVRMIAASFLIKDLRIDWRRGEEWFWDTLVDADLANNSASWQWVAGCGTDSSPYFRVFNPALQARRFDPDGSYIRRWVPELSELPDEYLAEPWTMPALDREALGVRLGQTYPFPIVDHAAARRAALDAYQHMKMIAGLDG
ncbi:MAG: cryptochrome/photolyase family protein [Alphaproteobacteria bacterium]